MRSSEPSEFDSTVYKIHGLGQDTCHTQIILLQKKKKKEDANAYSSLLTKNYEN